jgi:hypothetical protein
MGRQAALGSQFGRQRLKSAAPCGDDVAGFMKRHPLGSRRPATAPRASVDADSRHVVSSRSNTWLRLPMSCSARHPSARWIITQLPNPRACQPGRGLPRRNSSIFGNQWIGGVGASLDLRRKANVLTRAVLAKTRNFPARKWHVLAQFRGWYRRGD